MQDPIFKVVASLGISSLAAIVESFQAFSGIIQTLGLPLVCVGGFAYAIIVLSKKKDAETAGRLEDAKAYADKLTIHVEKGAEARAKHIEISEKLLELNGEQLKAQAKMAISMDDLTHEIRRCQQQHSRP
jgi:hypothetical protein